MQARELGPSLGQPVEEDRRIVGRDAELVALRSFVRESRLPAALVVEGEAGIGKTTLLEVTKTLAHERSWTVLAARPALAEARLSFTVLGDLIAPVFDRFAPALPEPQRHALAVALLLEPAGSATVNSRVVGLALRALLGRLASERPVLVCLDDVQWLDAPTATALSFALRRLRDERLAVVAGLRAGETTDLELPTPERHVLAGLSLGALHHLLRSRDLALPRPALMRVHTASGGNPFYAIQLARALAESDSVFTAGRPLPLPQDLAELTRGRLELLSEQGRFDLALAAAMGTPTLERLAAASRRPGVRRRFEAAADVGIVRLADEHVRFAHPLFADAAYAQLDPARRREVHRRLADVVDDPEERARHLALAADGPDEAVASALESAARGAVARGAPESASELHELAARLTPKRSPDSDRRVIAAAEQRLTAGDATGARTLLEALVGELPLGERRARALLLLANTREDDFEEAVSIAERALAEAEGDLELAVGARCYLCWTYGLVGDVERSLTHGQAAVALAEQRGGKARLIDALTALGLTEMSVGRATEGMLERAVSLEVEADASGRERPVYYRSPRGILGRRLLYEDRLDEAREELLAAHRLSVARGDFFERPSTLFYLSELECLTGRWDEAERLAREGLDFAEQLGLAQTELSLLIAGAKVDAHRGRIDAAREGAARALAGAATLGDAVFSVRAQAVLGFLDLSLGDPEAASRHLEPAAARSAGRAPSYHRLLPDAIEAAVETGLIDRARELLHSLDQAPNPWARATASRCRALLEAAGGETGAALRSLDEALRIHESLPMPFERARTLLVFGVTLRRARQKRRAREALDAAMAAFEALGAPLWIEKTRAELRRIGGRPPSRKELTPTEERVAELVASGLSNKEVAARLFVTVRTVEANLTRIYGKLAVRSRAELASRLSRS